jgi:hypothetical protein
MSKRLPDAFPRPSITYSVVFWFVVGLLVAVVFDYALYRMALPIKPFIYQAF